MASNMACSAVYDQTRDPVTSQHSAVVPAEQLANQHACHFHGHKPMFNVLSKVTFTAID